MMPGLRGRFPTGTLNPSFRKSANPAPLGLCALALMALVLSLINTQTRGVTVPAVVVGSAYTCGGLEQLLAGMWEMAVRSESPRKEADFFLTLSPSFFLC